MKEHHEPSYSEEVADLPVWDQAFWLSRAYIEASQCLCQSMLDGNFSSQYSASRVILHLARHGVELFLKAAIAARTGSASFPATHDLDRLYTEYRQSYPDLSFAFNLPGLFRVADSWDLFPEEAKVFHSTLDQRHRYPSDRTGNSFFTQEEFDPQAMHLDLKTLDRDLKVLESAFIKRMLAGLDPIK